MARDYAKPRNPNGGQGTRGNGSRGGSSANRRGNGGGSSAAAPPMPGWVWLLMGLAIGLAVAAIVYVGRPSNKIKLGAAANVTAESAAATAKQDDDRKPIPLPPKQASRFAFYEMLPAYEVVIPRESSGKAATANPGQTPKQTTAPAAADQPPDIRQALAEPGQYLIQVGAYRSRDEADKNRASLALLGVESRIEQVTIDQKDTWYRVRIGPQATLAKAQEILERLESNDIKGLLIKVKS